MVVDKFKKFYKLKQKKNIKVLVNLMYILIICVYLIDFTLLIKH